MNSGKEHTGCVVLTAGAQFMRFYEKNLALNSFSVPIKFPIVCFYQLWHERAHHAPEPKWLRDQVAGPW